MTDKPALSDAKRALLEKMMRGGGATAAAPAAEIPRRAPGAPIPLSADQRQVWLHESMAPAVPLYNESITIHRFGTYDHGAMERAFNALLERHESWRSGFSLVDGEPAPFIHETVHLPLAFADVSHLADTERDAAAVAIGAADARCPIDLTDVPLLRATAVRLADDEHRIYVTLHHIVFDGVSLYRVIVPELAALYDAFVAGEPSPLPPPGLQYGDYAVWQQAHLASPPIRHQIETWRERLADAPAKVELAGDRPKPAVPSYVGSQEVFMIPLPLAEALRALSGREGVTLYMTLLAAFKTMLLRYTGAEDIVIGGVTDLRRRPELERVVGYFLNIVALRSQPRGDLPFRAYLAQVRDAVLGALANSEAPFDEVVRALGVRHQPGANPLFNLLFSIQPPVEASPPGWDLTQMDVTIGTAKFDLYLEMEDRPDGILGRFLYATELFDAATIRRMIGHWTTMLAGVVADPAAPLGRLPMLTAAETAQMGGWNETARDLISSPVHATVATQATAHPDRIAIRCEGRAWTYAELDTRANGIAARLRAAGVVKGHLVAIAVDRSPEMVAGLLGILKAGAAYLPLDPAFPPARLDLIVADAKPVALLTDPSVDLAGWSLPRILVEAPPSPAAPAAIDGADLAYVLYTSGSTGQPKGVEISHRALANLLGAIQERPGFSADDRLLAVTTLSFDIAMLELFLPLVSGGELVLAPRATAIDPIALADLIGASNPTVMQATPATWRGLIESNWRGAPSLKILCGGEALPRDLADRLLACSAELWNMYGPTETTIWSLVDRVSAEGPVAIGRPIANTTVHILDKAGNDVPIGAVGELCIGGVGLARGYRGRPDLTAQRFVDHAGTRVYRTGDLARFRPDGTVLCLGRTDAEEKIRGFRVAVEEVEGALAAHPAIAAAAVRSWPDSSGERALAAYLVGKGGTVPTPAELRAHLARTLPDYMIPARFETLPALPMTPNAKIDRTALPAPREGEAATDFTPPREGSEQKLATIWTDILNVGRIGRHDSFFDLGGHSLLVARLLRRVERDYDRRIGMAAFFRAHRLDEMAALLDARQAPAEDTLVPVQPKGWRPPLLWLDAGPTFLPLAEEIGTDQPFFGVPVDPILEREIGRTTRFEDIAALVVALIRQARPQGPYYIGGWCMSGILAYEVARQLRAAGEDVPLLVLAHAMNPTEHWRIGPIRLRWDKMRFHARQMIREGRGDRLRYLGARIEAVLEEMKISRKRTAAGTHGALRGALDHLALRYAPQDYDGDVVLFQPSERVAVLDGRPGWARVLRGRFAVQEIAGGHRTMLQRPHVAQFAAHLRDALIIARGAPGTAPARRGAG